MRVGEGQREEDTESEADSRLRAVSTEPDAGLELTNRETLPELKSVAQLTEAPSRPNVYLFLRDRERQSTSRGEAERGRHRIRSRLQAPSCQHRAQCGARTHEP